MPTDSPATELNFEDCFARLDGSELTLGNALIRRSWRILASGIQPLSLTDLATDREWLCEPDASNAPPADAVALREDASPVPCVQVAGLRGELLIEASAGPRRYQFQLFPGCAAIRMRVTQPREAAPKDASDAGAPSGVESPAASAASEDFIDLLPIAPRHVSLTHITLRSRTDAAYELVNCHTYAHIARERRLGLMGNLFTLEERFSGGGIALIRHGMLPESSPVRGSAPDVTVNSGRVALHEPPMTEDGETPSPGDWHALVLYQGGAHGATGALHTYERCLRTADPAADAWMLSNTWGDRNRDARVNETFMGGEATEATSLGIDVVQIDDGWQAGRSSNSAEEGGVWSGFWNDPNFWTPDPTRFPNGLTPITDELARTGGKLGLWYAPDSADHFANWSRDAERLLSLHREHGVNHFKLDSMDIDSRRGEMNVHRMLDALLDGSDGQIIIDLDTTAGRRPDYLSRPDVGPIFVENRYSDWGNYYPHLVLRDLWKLTQWIPPHRLRMQWLNPDRHLEQYEGDPLGPVNYGADYLFASVAVSAPLAWMELQHLSDQRKAEVKPVIAAWRKYRSEMHAGAVLPIGEAPDGTAWTGFLCCDPASPAPAHLLVFRELNEQESCRIDLPVALPASAKRIAGTVELKVKGSAISAAAAAPLSFGWYRLG